MLSLCVQLSILTHTDRERGALHGTQGSSQPVSLTAQSNRTSDGLRAPGCHVGLCSRTAAVWCLVLEDGRLGRSYWPAQQYWWLHGTQGKASNHACSFAQTISNFSKWLGQTDFLPVPYSLSVGDPARRTQRHHAVVKIKCWWKKNIIACNPQMLRTRHLCQ